MSPQLTHQGTAPRWFYLFAHPLSESLRTLDLGTASRGVRDWRTLPGVKPCDGVEEMVVERLLELERLQVVAVA